MTERIPDQVLHAYVDGALGESERRDVEARLMADAEAARRAQAYADINAALHAEYDAVLDEPHTLSVARAPRFVQRPALALAAALVLGIGIGYVGRGWQAQSPRAVPIARAVALAHAAYTPEVRHPVEVTAAEDKHLLAWLSKRLDAPLRAPSLSRFGYQLLGGRLLPPTEDDHAPLAMLMYENAQGKRLSLLIKREAAGRETAFRFSQNDGTRVFYWIDGAFGYALAGDLERDELQRIARSVYQQLNP